MSQTANGVRAQQRAPRLAVANVSVTFGGNRVLRDVTLTVNSAEIHALIGQNGSGKSTFAKVLTGLYQPDPGASVAIDGTSLQLPVRLQEARAHGVTVVHQSLGLVPDMTVLENMRVGRLRAGRFTRLINWRAERQAALDVFERLGRSVSLDRIVRDLSEEDRATTAIARSLQDVPEGGGLIIFDESTRALSRRSLEHFYEMLGGIVKQGTSALLITHRLEEVIDAADTVTVLRDGDLIESGLTVAGLSAPRLAEIMLGRALIGEISSGSGHAVAGTTAALDLHNLASRRLSGVSLKIAPGEIVGVTGLADSGYHELPYVLAGRSHGRSGSLTVAGVSVKLKGLDPLKAIDAGIALVPGDRELAGLALDQTVIENAALPHTAGHHNPLIPINRSGELKTLMPWFDKLQLRPRDPHAVVGKLSGGNQQKVVLAKWLAGSPKLLVLHEPTQAVDVGAREIIVEAVKEAAATGVGVLVASGDEAELSMLCDRVLVFRDGVIDRELAGPQHPDDIVNAIILAPPGGLLAPEATAEEASSPASAAPPEATTPASSPESETLESAAPADHEGNEASPVHESTPDPDSTRNITD